MFKKFVIWSLIMVMMAGMIPLAHAAYEVEAKATGTKIVTKDDKYYVVAKDNAPLELGIITGAKLKKGTLVEVSGESGNYMTIRLGAVSFRVKKEYLTRASETFTAQFNCTAKKVALRTIPTEDAKALKELQAKTLFLQVGSMTLSSKYTWLIVYDNGTLGYIPAECAEGTFEITMKLSAKYQSIRTLGKTQITATITPADLMGLPELEWTTSNKKIAKVSETGLAQGVSKGSAKIICKLGDLISATYSLNITAKVELNVPHYKQTDKRWRDVYYTSKATIGLYGCLLTSATMVYAYDTGTTIYPNEMMKKLKFSLNGNLQWASYEKMGYTMKSVSGKSKAETMQLIYKQLAKGRPVIIGAKSSNNQHYVVITGYVGTSTEKFSAKDFLINDPNGYSKSKTLDAFFDEFPSQLQIAY